MFPQNSFAKWFVELTFKLFKAAPLRSVTAILLSLLGQAALMIGTLLPIKVIMLLGVSSVPAYIPSPLDLLTKESLVLVLAALSVGMFLIYLAADKLCGYLIQVSSECVVAQAGKVILFENQDELARSSYEKIVTSTSGLIFFVVMLAVLAAIYLKLFFVLVIFGILSYPVVRWIWWKSRQLQSPQLYNRTVQNLNNVSFLACFTLIVVDHLYFVAPSILITIVAVILGRQGVSKFCAAVIALTDVGVKRDKVSAVFLEDHLLLGAAVEQADGIWGVMAQAAKSDWLPDILRQNGWSDEDFPVSRTQWLQTTVANVLAFWVQGASESKSSVIKIFDNNKKALAQHEAALLMSPGAELLPSPKLKYSGVVNGFTVHLLSSNGLKPLADRSKFGGFHDDLVRKISRWPVPQDLQDAYARSHPLLWQRLRGSLLDRVLLAANQNEYRQLLHVQNRLPDIARALSELPVCLINPNLTPRTVLQEGESLFGFQWGSWSLDVLGSQYQPVPQGLKSLRESIEDSFPDVDPLRAELASFMAAVVQHAHHQRFVDALELLPELIGRLRELSLYDGP